MTVTGTEKFSVNGSYKVGDGVLIKAGNTSRAVSQSEDTTDDTTYYKTDNGYYLVMVEKEGTLEFKPEIMQLAEGETISIGKFNNTYDFEITTEEHKANNLHNISEEYYYVDFSSPEFNDLKKSDIVIRQTGLALAENFSAITGKTVYNTYAPIDFSDESGFGIIQKRNENRQFEQPSYKIHVVNPIDIGVGKSAALTDLFSVLRIDSSSFVSGKEYCVEISGLDSEIVTAIAKEDYFEKTVLSNADHGYVEGLAIPYFFPEDGKIVFYIGTFEEDMMLDIDFESFYTKLTSVNCSASIIEKPEYIASAKDYNDAAGENVTLTAGYDSNDFITIVFTSTKDAKINLSAADNLDGCESTMGYFYHSRGYGGGISLSSGIDYDIYSGYMGYTVLNLAGREVKSGDEVGKIKLLEEKKITAGHVYKHESQSIYYVSEQGERWEGNYFIVGAYKEGNEFRAGTFVCTSTEKELENFYIKDGDMGQTGKEFTDTFKNYSGNDNRCRYSFSCEQDNLTYNFEIDEFSYISATDKSITGTMIITQGATEKAKYENVSFVWQPETSN